MASPPDMDPSELWLALTQMPRPHRRVDLPRCIPGTKTPIGEVLIQVLTQEEQMAVNAEADRFTKKLLQDPQKRDEANLGYQHTFSNEVALQILYRVCRDVNDVNRPAFPSPKLMRQFLTADEVGVMFQQYMVVQLELGPIVADMSDEEMEAWIRRIASGGSAFPFVSLSPEQQTRLVLFMASRLCSLWTAMSSAGLPPDDPTPSETAENTDAGVEDITPES